MNAENSRENPEVAASPSGSSGDATGADSWHVYLLRCADGSLYCGITKDVARRVQEHNGTARGSKYTRGRRPVYVVYQEGPYSHAEALRRELVVKKLRRALKESLVGNHAWQET